MSQQKQQRELIVRQKLLGKIAFREAPEIAERVAKVADHLRLRRGQQPTSRLLMRVGLVVMETLIEEGEL